MQEDTLTRLRPRLILGAASLITAATCTFTILGSAYAGPLAIQANNQPPSARFYNHPEGTIDLHQRDLGFCAKFAKSQLSGQIDTPEFVTNEERATASRAYGLIPNMLDILSVSGRKDNAGQALLDDCMVSLGWRSFEIAGQNQATFEALFASMPEEGKANYLFGKTPPSGQLLRGWRNSFWLGTEAGGSIKPGIRSASSRIDMSYVEGRKLSTLARVPMGAAEAIVVFQASQADGLRGNRALAFQTVNLETGLFAPAANPGVPDRFNPSGRGGFGIGTNPRNQSSNPNRQALIVPAGTYALSDITSNENQVPCFGTVGFNIQPGEVLVLGSFTFGPGATPQAFERQIPTSLRHDTMSDEAIGLTLAGYPGLILRAKPVDWLQDIRIPCFAWVPGFKPSYNWRLRWPESPAKQPITSPQASQVKATN